MIVRMTEGFDRRFGYDYNQLNHVMELWTGFIKGEMPGARGETLKLTLADDLAAAYAFMQGMRDNGGLIGMYHTCGTKFKQRSQSRQQHVNGDGSRA